MMITSDTEGSAGLLFQSFAIVDPQEEPEDWSYAKGETWINSAFYVSLAIEDMPFKVSDDGEIRFSRKTQVGSINFAHQSGCVVVTYKTIRDCEVSISGKLDKVDGKGLLSDDHRMTGDLVIKIITPEDDRWILNYKEMTFDYIGTVLLKQYL